MGLNNFNATAQLRTEEGGRWNPPLSPRVQQYYYPPPLSLALWPTARALTYMLVVVVVVVVAAFHCLVALYKFTPPVLVAWKERRRISTH